jgi:PAS domain S-box-containing protein
LSEEVYGREFEVLRTANYVDAHDALTDPRVAGYLEGYIKPNGITSMLDVVIRSRGRNLGLICLEHVGRAHHWEEDEIAFACQLADQMALAIAHRERRRTEAELKTARDQYQSLVEQSPGITYRCRLDRDWTMMYMSNAVEGLTGYPASDFVNNAVRTFGSVIHPEDWEALEPEVLRACEEGRAWDVEYRVLHREGGERWVNEKGRAILGSDGLVEYLDGFIHDISERKESERALVEQTEAAIREIHPAVSIQRTSYCTTEVDVFGRWSSVATHGELAACVDPNYVTFDVPLTEDLNLDSLRAAVELIRDEVYRIKGFADVGGRRCRVDYSAAQWTCEEVDGDPPPALVLIVRGPCAPAVRQLIRTLQPENPSSPDKVL